VDVPGAHLQHPCMAPGYRAGTPVWLRSDKISAVTQYRDGRLSVCGASDTGKRFLLQALGTGSVAQNPGPLSGMNRGRPLGSGRGSRCPGPAA